MAATEPNVPYHMDRRTTDYPSKKVPKYGWRDDNGRPIHGIDEDGTPICGRILIKSKKPCRCRIVCVNGRCPKKSHGGDMPGAKLKHGRYSLFLPTRLAAHYDEMAKDDVLKNIREHIGILGAMVRAKIEELGEESGAELWRDALSVFAQLKDARAQENDKALDSAIRRLDKVLNDGRGIQAKEAEIAALMRKGGDLSNVEIKRMEKLRVFMTPQQMLANQAAVISVLKKYVEPTVLSRVSAELGAIASCGYRGRPGRENP